MRLGGKKRRRLQRILIVEDEPLVAFDMERELRTEGFDVVATVDSVAAALDAMNTDDTIDLVVADLGLPDGDGVMVGLAAKRSNIPILFSTARFDDAARAVATACILKPYRTSQLSAAIAYIEAALDGRAPKRVPDRFTFFEA